MSRTLRLPDDVESGIRELAVLHDRSENAEIIQALKMYIRSMRVCSKCGKTAEIECKIGKCAPSKWFCGVCYIDEHIPE
jgi:Arc-like DNA binding domain